MNKLKVSNGKYIEEIEYDSSAILVKSHKNDSLIGVKYIIEFNLLSNNINIIKNISSLLDGSKDRFLVIIDEYNISLKCKENSFVNYYISYYSNIKDKSSDNPILYMEVILYD